MPCRPQYLERRVCKFRKPGNVGRSARVAISTLDKITEKGNASTGILLDNGSVLFINTSENVGVDKLGDSRIIDCARSLNTLNPQVKVLSNDINLRARARSYGLEAQKYELDKYHYKDLYTGFKTIKNSFAGFDLQKDKSIDQKMYEGVSLEENECVLFLDDSNQSICLGRKVGDVIKRVNTTSAWGITSKNKEQALALDMLLDPALPLVTLIGSAGSGKTLLALAAGLEMVIEKSLFNKIMIFRPMHSVGEGTGWLPGSLEEKMHPWFLGVMDNFEILCGANKRVGVGKHKDGKKDMKFELDFEFLKKHDRIQLEALSYIRGRSIVNSLVIVDEAQNLTREEMKTILTRAGENTKFIFLGDIQQIDAPKLDSVNNGLTYLAEKFRGNHLHGHLTLTECERSPLAAAAVALLQ
jgi:PhoH-like ATPase